MNAALRLVVLMPIAALLGCNARADQAAAMAKPTQRPVLVATPLAFETPPRIRGIGRLESVEELRLSFKVSGVVADVAVDTGDRVEAGQILARLDTTETSAAVTRAEEALRKAERDLTRAEEVFARGLVAREVRDNAATARDIAAADLRGARFNQRFATITAPAAGQVKQRLAEAGEMIAASQPVLTISSGSRGWVLRTELADRDALRIAPGDRAELRLDALPGQRFAAKAIRIGGEADATTGTIAVEFAVDGGDAPLRSGLLGKLDIQPGGDASGWSIPVSALLHAEAAEARVMVVVEGRAQSRSIALGGIVGDRVEVRDGLRADDQVIVGGAAWVDHGEAVRVVVK
jgi:RND family efflux transporter MFP subunit